MRVHGQAGYLALQVTKFLLQLSFSARVNLGTIGRQISQTRPHSSASRHTVECAHTYYTQGVSYWTTERHAIAVLSCGYLYTYTWTVIVLFYFIFKRKHAMMATLTADILDEAKIVAGREMQNVLCISAGVWAPAGRLSVRVRHL